MEMIKLVTLESLLDGPSYYYKSPSIDTEIDDMMDMLMVHESICILEQNIVAYEAAYNVEMALNRITYENGISPYMIALENGFTDVFKKIGEKIKKKENIT
jgi:hypothetical protein